MFIFYLHRTVTTLYNFRSNLVYSHLLASDEMLRFGGVAHRLEQAAHNRLVDGSIPSTPTRALIYISSACFRAVVSSSLMLSASCSIALLGEETAHGSY